MDATRRVFRALSAAETTAVNVRTARRRHNLLVQIVRDNLTHNSNILLLLFIAGVAVGCACVALAVFVTRFLPAQHPGAVYPWWVVCVLVFGGVSSVWHVALMVVALDHMTALHMCAALLARATTWGMVLSRYVQADRQDHLDACLACMHDSLAWTPSELRQQTQCMERIQARSTRSRDTSV
jgi:hypothetical protein